MTRVYKRLGSKVAKVGAQRTPQRLQRDGPNAALHHAVADIVETRECLGHIAVRPRPEYFGRSRGARPENGVQVGWVRLLGPQK